MFHTETQNAMNATLDKARAEYEQSKTNAERNAAVRALIEAKAAEEKAKAARLAAEVEVIRLFGAKQEGAQTVKTEKFGVTTTGNLDYKLDRDGLKATGVPMSELESVVRFVPELKVGAYRKLQASNPDLYAKISDCLTVKPAKTSVEVSILSLNS